VEALVRHWLDTDDKSRSSIAEHHQKIPRAAPLAMSRFFTQAGIRRAHARFEHLSGRYIVVKT